MTLVETAAKLEGKARPFMVRNFPDWLSVFLMSMGGKLF